MKQREIKFKAWDKREHRWYHKIIEWVFDKPKGSIGQLPELPKDIILLQYTGLKDNTKWEDLNKDEQREWISSGHNAFDWQGKEIYEGDILLNILPVSPEFKLGQFIVEDICLPLIEHGSELKVIGNIYDKKRNQKM